MSDKILSDKILSWSAFSHIIAVPIEKIDIADWLFNLPEAEYQRCCTPDYISCGVTCTDDGIRMSINVEMVGLRCGNRNAHALPNGLYFRCVHSKWSHKGSGDLDA
jgi:hypothetical protein